MGIWLPELITIFLEPDYSALAFALFDLGLSDDEVGQVLVESHPPDDVREQVADSSRATVRYLQEMGVLDDPATREAFLTAGMLLS